MVRGDTAFACALKATSDLTTAIQRLHGRPAQRSEAHSRDVDDGGRPKRTRPPPGSAHHLRAWNPELRIESLITRMISLQRKGVVLDDEITRLQLHLVV